MSMPTYHNPKSHGYTFEALEVALEDARFDREMKIWRHEPIAGAQSRYEVAFDALVEAVRRHPHAVHTLNRGELAAAGIVEVK